MNELPQVVKPRPTARDVIVDALTKRHEELSGEASPRDFDGTSQIMRALAAEGFLLIRPDDEGAVEQVAKTHYEYGQGGKWDRPADAPDAPFPAYADEHDKSQYRDYARRLLASLGAGQ